MLIFDTLEFPIETQKKKLFKYSLLISLAIFIIATSSFYILDQQVTYIFRYDDTKWVLAREITNIGLFNYYFVPALVVFTISFFLTKTSFTEKKKIQSILNFSKNLMLALLFSGVFTHVLKFMIGRQRPKISPNFDPHIFHPFILHWDFHSLPSGHSQVLFTVATYFSFYFPKKKYYFYFLALLLGFTRVMTRDHFLSDVLLGVLVGHLSTVWFIFWVQKRSH